MPFFTCAVWAGATYILLEAFLNFIIFLICSEVGFEGLERDLKPLVPPNRSYFYLLVTMVM
jgi:hypothetical protein